MPENTAEHGVPEARGGPGRLAALVAWFATALVAGLILARLAVLVQIHAQFAPLIVFPLLLGTLLGAVVAGLMLLFGVNRKSALWATAILALATVAAEHYFFFCAQREREFAKAYERARKDRPSLDIADVPRPGLGLNQFVDYVRSQAAYPRPLLWLLDAALVLIAAVGIVLGVLRSVTAPRPAIGKVHA